MFPPHLIWVWHQSLVMKTKMVLTRLHNNNRCRRNKSFKNDFFYNFGFKIDENNRLNCHLDEPQGRFVNFNQNKFRTNFNRRSLDALLLIQIQKKTEQKIDFCWLVKPAKALPTSRLRSNWTWLRRKSAFGSSWHWNAAAADQGANLIKLPSNVIYSFGVKKEF
jgi:hypothetical protein